LFVNSSDTTIPPNLRGGLLASSPSDSPKPDADSPPETGACFKLNYEPLYTCRERTLDQCREDRYGEWPYRVGYPANQKKPDTCFKPGTQCPAGSEGGTQVGDYFGIHVAYCETDLPLPGIGDTICRAGGSDDVNITNLRGWRDCSSSLWSQMLNGCYNASLDVHYDPVPYCTNGDGQLYYHHGGIRQRGCYLMREIYYTCAAPQNSSSPTPANPGDD
jgi:hypothetical protein